MERPDELLSITFTRRQWGLLSTAARNVAKTRRYKNQRNPFIPEPGKVNHNLESAEALEGISAFISLLLAG